MKVGEKVVRVYWRLGHPCTEYGTVTNVRNGISVNGRRIGSRHGWKRDIFKAIDQAYLALFQDGLEWFEPRYLGVNEYVIRVCRLRRFEAKFRKFKSRQG